jgi:3-hydroxyacyl-[acyl-carrier-protein] dehydratase
MPGVLMIEALAQTSALLAFLTMGQKPDENAVVYFLGIDNTRFKRPVVPGDQLLMLVEIQRHSRGIWKFKTQATVDGQIAVEADLMCTMRSIADSTPTE